MFGGRGDLTEWYKDHTFTLISERKQIWNDIITPQECIVPVTDVLMGLVDVTCPYKSQTKLALGQAILRLKRERIVKEEGGKKIRTEIAQHLKAGMEAKAFVMVQQMLVGQRLVEAYNVLISFCNLILDRLDLLQISRECPPDLKQAVASLIYAAPRCADKEQLLQARKLLAKKYHAVATAADSLAPNCEVHPTIRDGFQGALPTHAQQARVLGEIAKEWKISWSDHLPESQPQASVPVRTTPHFRGSLKPLEAHATARDASLGVPAPVRNASRAPSAAESGRGGEIHWTPPRTPATPTAGNSRVPGESSRAGSVGEGGGERQASPATPVRHEGSVSGSSGPMWERDSGGTAGRQREILREATLLPSMDEWMDVEVPEGSLPVYLEDSDDDVGVPQSSPSTPQVPFEEGERSRSPARVHHYAHAEADSIRDVGSGGERKVESGGGVQSKSPTSESGEKQQELKSKISQNMIEIGQLLEAAKRSGEEIRDRRTTPTATQQHSSRASLVMDTSPGCADSSGEAAAWNSDHGSACSSGGGGAGSVWSRDWDGSRGRESAETPFAERGGDRGRGRGEAKDHGLGAQMQGQQTNGYGERASGEQERWPEALDYGKVVNKAFEGRGPDRMVRDANEEDEECLSGFEDLEEFFTKQKKRAVEARRCDWNEA